MSINEELREKLLEARKKEILKAILTPKARSRLMNIKLARPEYAQLIENQLIQLAQLGRIERIDDNKFKQLLKSFAKSKKEYKIKRF